MNTKLNHLIFDLECRLSELEELSSRMWRDLQDALPENAQELEKSLAEIEAELAEVRNLLFSIDDDTDRDFERAVREGRE
jgi:hypothetical protein